MKRIKKITIKIATVNTSFFEPAGGDCIAAEIAHILHNLAENIEEGDISLHPGAEVSVNDSNGNVVGFARTR